VIAYRVSVSEAKVEERALRFIGEKIEPLFDEERGFEKRPGCPSGFVWQERTYRINECLLEWRDYARRGKMARNMRPAHSAAAEKRGSWGVGRHYFRVSTTGGRVFDLYYDRAPKDAVDRKGSWHLLREMDAGASEGGPAQMPEGEEQP